MSVTIEATEGLSRTLKVVIPAAELKKKEAEIIRKIAKNRRFDGFRSGKVPFAFVAKECRDEIDARVVDEIIEQNTYKSILDAKIDDLTNGVPVVSIQDDLDYAKDFEYKVEVEVYPEIQFNLGEVELEKQVLTLGDADVDLMIESIRKTFAQFKVKDGESVDGDRVTVVFEEVEGGSAEVVGRQFASIVNPSNGRTSFINDHILGKKVGDVVEFTDTKTDEEGNTTETKFKFTVKEVAAPELPELNDEFIKRVNPEGEPQNFRKDLLTNIERELLTKVEDVNIDTVMTKLLDLYKDVELPKNLIKQNIYGFKNYAEKHNQVVTDEQIEQIINRNVRVESINHALVKQFEIKPDSKEVTNFVKRISSAFENSEMYQAEIMSNKHQMSKIAERCWTLQIVNTVFANAKVSEKQVGFKDFQ
jgi:trigger factor